MHSEATWTTLLNRRAFLENSFTGLGAVALASLGEGLRPAAALGAGGSPATGLGSLETLHHAPKVKRVIHLCMAGGQSHLESFDPKPKLAEMDGEPMPTSFTEGQQLAQLQGRRDQLKCFAPRFAFERRGDCGTEISEALPHLGGEADAIAVIRSMKTEQINHDPAHTFMNTGSIIPGRPSMGAWVSYGIGSEAADLPSYVVLVSEGGGQAQPIASRQWSSGFLPSKHQGVEFQSAGDPVHYVHNPGGVTREAQRGLIDAVRGLDRLGGAGRFDPELESRIAQYELAFQMQASVPGLTDLSDETPATLERYGCEPGDGSFASNCLLARRLAERGVRFIQLYHRGWDHHGSIESGFRTAAGLTDQGAAALIADLRERGLLADTLVIYGGEFGRTPMAQGTGRDHHIKAFSVFLCGGGVQGGTVHGATDELGYDVVEDPVEVHDLHATMLHLLGIDHRRLTYRFQGRDFRLTDVHGKLVAPVLS